MEAQMLRSMHIGRSITGPFMQQLLQQRGQGNEVLGLFETWCLTQRTGEVTGITNQQEVRDFMEHSVAVKSRTKWAQQTITAVKTWTQRLAWYHGYISREDWPEGDHSFLRNIRMDPAQASSGLAVGIRDTVNSSRHVLEEHQMQQTYRFALTQVPKRQMLLHNVYASVTLQTIVHPNEMSYMVSLDMSMSVRPHLKFGNVHLFELGGVGKAKVTAAAEKCPHNSLVSVKD